MIQVLHIANWYPADDNPVEGIFIKEHIDSLEPYATNTRYALKYQVSQHLRLRKKQLQDHTIEYTISCPLSSWKVREILLSFLVFFVVAKNYRKIDIINFHIAYPLLTYWHIVVKAIKKPIVCTEHWSAYAKNFNLPNTLSAHKVLKPIKRIFKNDIFFITVSKYLAQNIVDFSGEKITFQVLGNVISSDFVYDSSVLKQPHYFLMVAVWRLGKDAFTVIQAFDELRKNSPKIILKIAGDGDQIPHIKELIKNLNLTQNVELLGSVSKEELAFEMKRATAFIHNSTMETFSVVCVESLSCGTPVIASKLPAIEEYLRPNIDGYLVAKNTKEDWVKSITLFIDNEVNMNAEAISTRIQYLFSKENIGKKYHALLNQRLQENK